MQPTPVLPFVLDPGVAQGVPPLAPAELAAFLGGGAPSLAVGLDPRVPTLDAASRLLVTLATAPEGTRLTVVTAEPGDGRSTAAWQLAGRLAERRDVAVGLWTRATPFAPEEALAHVAEHLPSDGARESWRRVVHVVDDAHEVLPQVFASVRKLARARGTELPYDLVLFAESRAFVRVGGEARPWLASARELATWHGVSEVTVDRAAAPDAGTARASAAHQRAADELARAHGLVGPAPDSAQVSRVADVLARGAAGARVEGSAPSRTPDASDAADPEAAAPGRLFDAVRVALVGDEDAWRARAERWLGALDGLRVGAVDARDALVILAVPAMLGLVGVPEPVLAAALGAGEAADLDGAPGAGPGTGGGVSLAATLARALAPLATRVPLTRLVHESGVAHWTTRHAVVGGAVVDALVDAGVAPLRAPLERLVDAALRAAEAPGPALAGAARSRGVVEATPEQWAASRLARLAAALARPPEAVRWLLDDTGAEELAVDLARRAAAAAPRVELRADVVTALRRAGRAPESCAEAARAVAGLADLEGSPEQARRLCGSWAVSELRRGGDDALARCVAVQLFALSDDVPAPRGGRLGDDDLPRGPLEVALRTLAWLAAEASHHGALGQELAERLRALAPFAAADPPERHERDSDRARIEVTRPADVPFEPDAFNVFLEGLDALVRHARPFEVGAGRPLGFRAATRAYRRHVAARIGPLVRMLPDVASAASVGDALQDAFEAWLAAGGVKPYEAQMEAYFSVFAGASVLLNTPTGSGKSLVALAAHFAALGRGERSVYTAPTKALVNEKFFDLCGRFGSANVGLLTGDASVNRDAPIVCCTAEILSNLAQVEGAARPFGWVVMDEFHYFSDKERGIAWLLPLMLLDGARFLLMSATIGEVHEAKTLVEALTAQPFELVRSTVRPVPLSFSYKVATEREAINELRDTSLLPGYVVCVTRNEAAEKALAEPSSGGWSSKKVDVPKHVFTSPFGRRLERALRAGIGLHHSGLLPKYRRLVENLSAANELALIFGTDTLGVGVNLPIRTVLFPQLVRNSGKDEYVRLDAARFQQLAGRAGRAGYATKRGDPQGDVWVLAPEDEVLRVKAAAKAAAKGEKAKKAAPKAAAKPGPKMPSWSEQTMQNLAASPARPLEVRFEVTAALVMNFVRRGERGVARLRTLIEALPLKPSEREALLRDLERVLDTLVARREVRAKDGGGAAERSFAVGERSVRRRDDEEAGATTFDRPLLRFVHDVAWDFITDEDGPALDLLTLVESIVDDPRVVLGRQAKKLRDEHWQAHREEGTDAFDQSARRDFGEERAEIEHPQPLKDELLAAFERWDAEHPGLVRETPSPKSVVRDMYELGMGFREYVQHYGLAVVEGELLRHLSEVWRVLVKGLPPGPELERGTRELGEWLGALVRHVDSSLIDEWERLEDPDRAVDPSAAEPTALPFDVTTSPRAFTRMVRNAAFRWVRALVAREYDGLATADLGAEAIAAAHRAYLDECGRIDTGVAGRSPRLCEYQYGETRVEQTLADPEGYFEWSLVGRVELTASREEGDAVLVLERFERKGL